MSQDATTLCDEALGCYDYMHRAYKQALTLLRAGAPVEELQGALTEACEHQARLQRFEARLSEALSSLPPQRLRALETAVRECTHLNAQVSAAVTDRLALLGGELAESARVGEALSGYHSGK